jgi:hypothetical protein
MRSDYRFRGMAFQLSGRFRSPLSVRRERVRVRVFLLIPAEDPHPSPLPEYRERE